MLLDMLSPLPYALLPIVCLANSYSTFSAQGICWSLWAFLAFTILYCLSTLGGEGTSGEDRSSWVLAYPVLTQYLA